MKARFTEVRGGRSDIADSLSAARSARNRATRETGLQATEDRARVRHHKRKRASEERDLKRASRIRIQMPKTERPRLGGRTPRKLFHRLGGQVIRKVTGSASGSTGAATRSIHFAVVARGFASRTGRRWRAGEGERAALYIVREEGLEGGEAGWWSNIAEDRNELAAFHRVSEALEKHDRKNANVYVTEIIALDASLSARQRRKAVRRYCRYFEKRGLPFSVAMHAPDPAGDRRNYHCHILYSLRPTQRIAPYDWSFAVSKVADVNTKAGILERRCLIVDTLNATLAAAGKPRRYTPLSNRARGLAPGEPKIGQRATWAARRADGEEARSATLERLQTAVLKIRTGLRSVETVRALGGRLAASLAVAGDSVSPRSPERNARMTRVRFSMIDRIRTTDTGLPARARFGLDIAWMNVKSMLSVAPERFPLSAGVHARIAAMGSVAVSRKHRRDVLTATRLRIAQPPRDPGSARLHIVTRLSDRYLAITPVRARQGSAIAAARARLETHLRNLRPMLLSDTARRLEEVGGHLFRLRRLEAMRAAIKQRYDANVRLRLLHGSTGASLEAGGGQIHHSLNTHATRLEAIARHVADRHADAIERRRMPVVKPPTQDEPAVQTTPASPSSMSHADPLTQLHELARQRAQKAAERKKAAGAGLAASPESSSGAEAERASEAASSAKGVQSTPGGSDRQAQAAALRPQPTAPSDGKPGDRSEQDGDLPWWQGFSGRGGDGRG